MSLSGVAKETVSICERGWYALPSGKKISLRTEIDAAKSGSVLYTHDALDDLISELSTSPGTQETLPQISVVNESTGAAARRLIEVDGLESVALLNFASAKNPGGGFLGGARAQEEDLARCSALYVCQLEHRPYYDANRSCSSFLYTEHQIFSPKVPFFRGEDHKLLEQPFFADVVTAPAPNAGEHYLRRGSPAELRSVLFDRAASVLRVFASHRATNIILGAWGCGVFRNNPEDVAEAFYTALQLPELQQRFSRVVFAVLDRSKHTENYRVFADRFR